MIIANVAELKNKLSKFLTFVDQGEEVEICKHNIPVARLIPVKPKKRKNRTQLGCGLGSVQIHTDLTQPLMPDSVWEMLKK
ncbi:MAG: type II toxin-antitoxin system Phd/YefM family antitoxin [Desulfobacteraceae bacterium]|nr:MAG: type II toxin-antitoxin system Phd/YefM family antitoxin [Desulfobacteraceae bacterium]